MSKSVYTVEMIETMTAQAPLNAEKCAALATEFGLGITSRSVIAKAKVRALTTKLKQNQLAKKRQRQSWILSKQLQKR